METFDIEKAIKAQKEFLIKKGYPRFGPANGICYRCNKNIYTEIDHRGYKTGISVEKAGSQLVTGFPHCNYSYVD